MPSNMINVALLSLASMAVAAPWEHKSWSKPDCSQPAPTGRGARFYEKFCGAQSTGAVALAMPAGGSEVMEAPMDTAVATDFTTVTNVQTVVVTPSPVANEGIPTAAATEAAASTVSAESVAVPVVAANFRKTSNTPAPAATPTNTYVAPAVVASAGGAVASAGSSGASASAGSVAASGSKRGIAYNQASLVTPFGSSKKVTWAYNWGSSSAGLGSNFEYIPMLWGNGAGPTASWQSDATKAIAAGSSALLGFNEPDHPQQANLPYATAATAYKQLITTPFAGKARLGSPAVTNGGGAMGLTYLQNFMNACTDCQIDFVAIHWYDSATNIQYFKDHVTQAHTMTGKPVWITEFGTTSGTSDQINTFIQTVLPWLESQSFVERYSYFMAADGILNTGSGLSSNGQTYATA